MKDEYEGRSGNRLAAMLRGILNPRERWTRDSDNNQEFLESLNDWEILTGEYRAAVERMFLIEFWLPLFLNMPQLGIRTLCVPFLPSRRRITLRCDVGSRTIAYLHVPLLTK